MKKIKKITEKYFGKYKIFSRTFVAQNQTEQKMQNYLKNTSFGCGMAHPFGGILHTWHRYNL
ncbi:MAG: hypothetical protein ACOVO2_18080 [Emticicia sp.]